MSGQTSSSATKVLTWLVRILIALPGSLIRSVRTLKNSLFSQPLNHSRILFLLGMLYRMKTRSKASNDSLGSLAV